MDRYNNITQLKSPKGKVYRGTTKYPDIPLDFGDVYVISTLGDRLDILAEQYYSDPTLWWVISIANTQLPQGSYYIPGGTQLRIPTNIGGILAEYNRLNLI